MEKQIKSISTPFFLENPVERNGKRRWKQKKYIHKVCQGKTGSPLGKSSISTGNQQTNKQIILKLSTGYPQKQVSFVDNNANPL